jgi:hypothetical protein
VFEMRSSMLYTLCLHNNHGCYKLGFVFHSLCSCNGNICFLCGGSRVSCLAHCLFVHGYAYSMVVQVSLLDLSLLFKKFVTFTVSLLRVETATFNRFRSHICSLARNFLIRVHLTQRYSNKLY